MKLIIVIFAILCIFTTLQGCADFKDTNELIAQANIQNRVAYAAGMAACGDNAACQVGVTSSYFSNAGQQQFFKPETGVDYLKAGMPYAQLGTQIYTAVKGGGTNTGGLTINGDNNQVSDVGNKKTADRGSTQYNGTTSTKTDEHVTNVGDGQANSDKSTKTDNSTNGEPVTQ